MANRTLIFGTCYVGTYQALQVIELWAKVTRKLNPDKPIMMFDNASPMNISAALAANDIELYQIGDNIGHLNATGKDGWGRSFSVGVQYAIDAGYDWIVHLDYDLIFAQPVAPTLAQMAKAGVKVAMPIAMPHMFTESALLFASVPYLQEIDFIGKYDWANPPRDGNVYNIPECRCERVFGDDLFLLNLRGYRGHFGGIGWQNFDKIAAYGLTWLHKMQDYSLYGKLLRLNGVEV